MTLGIYHLVSIEDFVIWESYARLVVYIAMALGRYAIQAGPFTPASALGLRFLEPVPSYHARVYLFRERF